jgi:hypothetical protein
MIVRGIKFITLTNSQRRSKTPFFYPKPLHVFRVICYETGQFGRA